MEALIGHLPRTHTQLYSEVGTVSDNLSQNLGGSLNIRASGGDGNIVTFASKDSKLAQYIDITSKGVKLNCKVDGEWGNTINLATKNDIPTRYDSVIITAAKSCRLIFSDSSAFAALVLIQGTTGDGFGAFLVNGYGNEGGPSRYRVSSLNTSGSESRISYAIGTAGEKSITFTNDSTGPVRLMAEEFFNETKISFQIV